MVPDPGASPDNVEREIIEPIEESLAGISGVKSIESSSLDSFATTISSFTKATCRKRCRRFATRSTRSENDLPPEMEEPVLTKISLTDLPVVSLALSSDTLAIPCLTLLADPGITRAARAPGGGGGHSGANTREMSVDPS
jgi:HAE1 family hydrophobic/amphiphilic exporter-1